MKVITLISGGDTGGAKTHVHSLLQGLSRKIEVCMVCFTDGPFAQEARELGIPTRIISGRNPFRVLRADSRCGRWRRRAGRWNGRAWSPSDCPGSRGSG